MNRTRFAEDPDPGRPDPRGAVGDFLRKRGWLDSRRLISDELRAAVESCFVELFAAWHEDAGLIDVRWDAIAESLGTSRKPDPLLDPRHDLCELFCLVAGIGERGRAFDKAADKAGLKTELRSAAILRTLATAIRGLDRTHFADRELPEKVGLLFERVARWPFVEGAVASDWRSPTFRRDVKRYCDLTNLNLSEIDDELLPAQSNRSPGQPQHPATWLWVLGLPAASEWFAGRMRRTPRPSVRDEVLRAAHKLRDAFESWLLLNGLDARAFAVAGAEFQDEAARVFASLVEHTVDVPVESGPAYAWFRFEPNSAAGLRMWFANAAFAGRAERMPASIATKWLRVLKQELSSYRPRLNDDEVPPEGWEQRAHEESQAPAPRPVFGTEDILTKGWEQRVMAVLAVERPFAVARTAEGDALLAHRERVRIAKLCQDDDLLMPSERFDRDRDYFLACIDQVLQLEGLWEGMRQLLLAMRALKSPCVASDLRYWEEHDVAAAHHPRQPEEPWRCIPAKLVASFHEFVGKEEARDPELTALRSKFAAFCLNGLRDTWSETEREEAAASGRVRTNADMVEPSPDWRFCRVRAAKTLAINPEGRGHRLLQAASDMDPEPSVREVANDAYQSLRRGVGLPEGMSPRRAVLGAFWWLRQAHLMALAIEIDRDGAQRTRIKELSRTKEPERN